MSKPTAIPITGSQKVLRLVWCNTQIDDAIAANPNCPTDTSRQVDAWLLESERLTAEVLA